MSAHSLQNIESELKKRFQYKYIWGQKQNDIWDFHTNFIYSTLHWEELVLKMKQTAADNNLEKIDLFNYAANRWFNFWSSVAVEEIFCSIQNVVAVENKKDRQKDFFLGGVPFDHKTSVFPNQFNKSFEYAQNNKAELITWLFKNQSTQKRHHLKNRLFIVVFAENGEHWKLKAEISLLKNSIEKYVDGFKPEQLHSFTFVDEQITLSDIIWVSK